MTRCLTCGKGELAGSHDWKTGWTKIPCDGHPNGHKFVMNNLPDDENEFGFKDKFVMNRHRKEKLG